MDRFRALVCEDIKNIEDILQHLIPNNTDILNDINFFINGSSKRIRSITCLLYLKSNNININNNIINVLTAGELIHNASLLHDDVIDDSEFRRGNQTFLKKYNSKVAILSGDYILTVAIKHLLQIKNQDILNIFLGASEHMSNAELKQYVSRNKKINLSEYIEIIDGKTASLFQAIFESCAILSKLDRKTSIQLGQLIGQLFQINNDTQADSILNDKKNGLNTIIDIIGIEKTKSLKDNYKKKMGELIKSFPNKKYKDGLEDLIRQL